ncbi:XVIPCD domain-containing protein [Lysobacter sp. Root983]|uniref:XVIPCD domain-containing protein n=1 Tax=Lysobacter sp. Root983 TaxID=1736613 RepID=UPI0009E7F754|nr:XVIPCD domain-containing protein [Lysobacter sp. Root983]
MTTDRETQLLQAATASGISSRRELANFMAQVGHESHGLTKLEEGFRYTKGISQIPVKSAMREGAQALESARLEALRGRPEALADLMYGGRMGNDEPGDGYKYRGRGYMQLTGKDNYRSAGEALGLDLVHHPDLAAKPENAARIATWYWQHNVPQNAREDVTKATRAVNGGTNGLADRESRNERWLQTLTPELMEQLAAGRIGRAVEPPAPATPARTAPNAAADGVLKAGEKGPAIETLQKSLHALGYTDGKDRALNPDGHFGASTKEAVQAFQRAHGLKDDGVAGPKTLDALKKAEQTPLLSNPAHPDHAMFKQAVGGLEKLGPQAGFKNHAELERAAATLTFEAKVGGLERIDHVALSTNGTGLFAVQGNLNDPGHHRAHVNKQQAGEQPLEQSTFQLQQDTQQRQKLEAQANPNQTQPPPTRAMG